MIHLQRVEVAPNFGVNVFDLNRLKGGKLNEIFSRILNPFSVTSRLQFRSAVDMGGLAELQPVRKSVARGSLAASAVVGADQSLTIFSGTKSFSLQLDSAISCFGFVSDRVVVTGTLSGEILLWLINIAEGINEAKCVYRFSCGSSLFPILTGAGEETFQVVLNRGKCMLVFDTVACVSGNTDESTVAPVIVDLLQQQPLIDSSCFGSLLATVSPTSVTVTDSAEHRAVTWDLESCLRSFWAPSIGHLFVVTEAGDVVDCAWSNGLVGVSTVPKTVQGKPSSIEKTGLVVNPKVVDFRERVCVSVHNNDLFVYSMKSSQSGQFPIAPIVTEFQIDKQVPIKLNSAEDEVVGLEILANRTCAVLIEGPGNKIRTAYMSM